ncbi:VRR-NUC domain-containing protein [Spirosoma areae]
MSNTLSAEEYQALNQPGGKAKKARPETLSAAQFRAEHVDQDEHELQSLGIEWFRLAYPQLLLYAIPNAAKRSIVLAARLSDEGLVRGIPDLHLAYPCNGKPGLYIETKTVNGKPSDAQIKIHAYLRAVGYEVIMPQTFEQFQAGVLAYLKLY